MPRRTRHLDGHFEMKEEERKRSISLFTFDLPFFIANIMLILTLPFFIV